MPKRPETTNIIKNNFINFEIKKNTKDNSDIIKDKNDPNSDTEYISSNSFPIKTLSSVGNKSYDKMNKIIKERRLGFPKLKNDYFIESSSLMNNIEKSNTRKYNEEKIYFPRKKSYKKNLSFNKISNSNRTMNITNNKWNGNKKYKYKNEIKFHNFDDIVDDLFNKRKKK